MCALKILCIAVRCPPADKIRRRRKTRAGVTTIIGDYNVRRGPRTGIVNVGYAVAVTVRRFALAKAALIEECLNCS